MATTLIEDLKIDYPIFELKNKTSIPREILLADGETIVVPERGTCKIKSGNINSFPDFAIFDYKIPTISVLEDYGIITRNAAPAAEPVAAKVEKSVSESKPNSSYAPSGSGNTSDKNN